MKVKYGKGWSIDVQILGSIGVDLAELEAFESPGVGRAGRAGLLPLYLTVRVGILYRMQTRKRGGNFDRVGKCYFCVAFTPLGFRKARASRAAFRTENKMKKFIDFEEL